MCAQVINSLGLIFGLAGATILFFYGPPVLNVTRDGAEIVPWANSPSPEKVEQNKHKYDRHNLLSKLGIALIFLAFLLQFIAVWVA